MSQRAKSAIARIEASRVVAAPAEAVFTFLAKLENHWKLAGRWVEPLSIDDGSGLVRIHGPLGLRRTARTTVIDAEPHRVMHGTAELSGGTVARIAWELRANGGGTDVTLSADVDRAALGDRILLAVGGSSWMHRRLAAILDRLETEVA